MKKILLLLLSVIICVIGAIIIDTLQMAMTGIILITLGISGSLTMLFCLIWEGA